VFLQLMGKHGDGCLRIIADAIHTMYPRGNALDVSCVEAFAPVAPSRNLQILRSEQLNQKKQKAPQTSMIYVCLNIPSR
jgi:hypothetical protein